MRKGESQECHGMAAGPEKKNFSISKLQSNILTLTDWPPFVIGTPRPKGMMRESDQPAKRSVSFPFSSSFCIQVAFCANTKSCW